MANEAWTPTVLNKVKMLLAKGLSTAEIGKKIGMSKNAVVGKLNRLGWNAKSQEVPAKKSAYGKPVKKQTPKLTAKSAKKPILPAKSAKKSGRSKKSASVKPVKKPAGKASAPAPTPKVLPKANSKTLAMHQRIIQHSLELSSLKPDQCRWPIGDPDSEKFHFCGAPVFVGKPYCYEHCKMAYQFQPIKKKS
ncbi:MAG: GcrA family cell cycle regulator [Proteobacteria bacterium]|nr:GcrA family cell cycle regulator [Pseudomonadota bacterium]